MKLLKAIVISIAIVATVVGLLEFFMPRNAWLAGLVLYIAWHWYIIVPVVLAAVVVAWWWSRRAG